MTETIAWVLILGWAQSSSFAINDIKTEQACLELKTKIIEYQRINYTWTRVMENRMICFPYEKSR